MKHQIILIIGILLIVQNNKNSKLHPEKVSPSLFKNLIRGIIALQI